MTDVRPPAALGGTVARVEYGGTVVQVYPYSGTAVVVTYGGTFKGWSC